MKPSRHLINDVAAYDLNLSCAPHETESLLRVEEKNTQRGEKSLSGAESIKRKSPYRHALLLNDLPLPNPPSNLAIL